MKRLLYALTSVLLFAGVFTSCEKPNSTNEGSGTEKMGIIKGMVTDKEIGLPLSGVILELQPTGKQAQTTADGIYILDSLKTDIYTIKATKKGYNEYVSDEIRLSVGKTITLDIELEDEPFEPKEPELRKDYTETAFGMDLEMVYVQGGAFLMGATVEQGDDAEEDEKPVRRVKLDGYHIGKYEVTQAQWKAVMGSYYYSKGDDYPVYRMSRYAAQEFCKKLSEQTGKKYVLPTEAQWEYAARGGNKSQHYKYAGSNDVDEVAWYMANSGDTIHPVGTKKANELGLYDMSGNVGEWCSDLYGNYDENDTENPQGPIEGEWVYRGGSFFASPAGSCRVSSRGYLGGPDMLRYGFRVACISE
ncbi:MAG: SUMF1/EgtB/PvdO family nonheme iron enzyme [Bacteroidales bacterium]|nr:SUMF1/EgtB/PvdO family nonheme iron enzyme [Bacteroidales bacterium]